MTDRRSWKVLGRLIRWNAHRTMSLLFFPDFSPATAARRKTLNPVLKKMTALDLQPFLTYPAVIKLRHKGEQKSFDSPQKAEDFISSLSQKTTYTVAPQGNGRTAATNNLFGPAGGAWLKMPSCCPGEDGGRVDVDTCWISFIFLSSLLLGCYFYLSGATVFLLVRLIPPFFSGGD